MNETMTSFPHFSGRFSELRKREHIIKIREAIRLTEKSNEVIRKEITEYKESNKEVKIKVGKKYFLNTSLILNLILILYFVWKKEKRVC